MRCIFCKVRSDSSKSKEHIFPESLGNQDHILSPGWVCDKCNNYLSRKVEAPFLNSEYGKRARFEMTIPSKRGRIPAVTGFHPQSQSMVDLIHDGNSLSICPSDKKNEDEFIKTIRNQHRGSLYIPIAGNPIQSYETSRFIGMLALEALAYQCMHIDGWNTEIVDKTELDDLRNYVRYGKKEYIWPIHIRRIYPANMIFSDRETPEYQVLHEWDILFIPELEESVIGEFYAIIAILGVEYTINLGGTELYGYINWLKQNNNESYLYAGKNA